MKKLITIISAAISLISCTATPLPETLISKDQNKYHIEWSSNQTNPSLSIKLLHKGTYIIDLKGIKTNSYDVVMYKDDVVSIGITYEQAQPRPEVYLAIYKYKPMDLTTGVYKPDDLDLMYEHVSYTNSVGYNGIVDNFNN